MVAHVLSLLSDVVAADGVDIVDSLVESHVGAVVVQADVDVKSPERGEHNEDRLDEEDDDHDDGEESQDELGAAGGGVAARDPHCDREDDEDEADGEQGVQRSEADSSASKDVLSAVSHDNEGVRREGRHGNAKDEEDQRQH